MMKLGIERIANETECEIMFNQVSVDGQILWKFFSFFLQNSQTTALSSNCLTHFSHLADISEFNLPSVQHSTQTCQVKLGTTVAERVD